MEVMGPDRKLKFKGAGGMAQPKFNFVKTLLISQVSGRIASRHGPREVRLGFGADSQAAQGEHPVSAIGSAGVGEGTDSGLPPLSREL